MWKKMDLMDSECLSADELKEASDLFLSSAMQVNTETKLFTNSVNNTL